MSGPEYDGYERRKSGLTAKARRTFVRSSARRDRTLDPGHAVAIGLFVLIMLMGCLSALALYQQGQIVHSQQDIETAQGKINDNQRDLIDQQKELVYVERRDRVNSYQTAYRFCTRVNVDRAVLHWFASASGAPSKETRAYLRRLERKDGAPILDCTPNITGDPATYMQPRRQREFVRRWRDHELSPAEIGICRIQIGEIANPGRCLK